MVPKMPLSRTLLPRMYGDSALSLPLSQFPYPLFKGGLVGSHFANLPQTRIDLLPLLPKGTHVRPPPLHRLRLPLQTAHARLPRYRRAPHTR
jgi:hypothetical protein